MWRTPKKTVLCLPPAVARRLVALLVVLFPLIGITRPPTGKPHMIAQVSNPHCIPGGSFADEEAAMKGVTVNGATQKEKSLVAGIFVQLNKLSGGGSNPAFRNARVDFVNDLGNRKDGNCLPASQTSGYLQIARTCGGKSNPINAGLIVHEYGHQVGNNGFYGSYNKAVPNKCQVSNYCSYSLAGKTHGTRNEEFAEVFAAYVTAPNMLKSSCPQAYDFMHKNVFKGGPEPTCSASATSIFAGGNSAVTSKENMIGGFGTAGKDAVSGPWHGGIVSQSGDLSSLMQLLMMYEMSQQDTPEAQSVQEPQSGDAIQEVQPQSTPQVPFGELQQ